MVQDRQAYYLQGKCWLLKELSNKKLSYRKPIVRQLRTQYVNGIYGNSVKLVKISVI